MATGCCISESTQHGLSCTSEAASQKRCNLATGELTSKQRSSTSGEICAFRTHVLTHVVIAGLDKMLQPLKKAADLAKAQHPHLQRLVYLPPCCQMFSVLITLSVAIKVWWSLCSSFIKTELTKMYQTSCFCRPVLHVRYLCSSAYFILF